MQRESDVNRDVTTNVEQNETDDVEMTRSETDDLEKEQSKRKRQESKKHVSSILN